MAADAVSIVNAWHAALNAGDLERLVALSAADIEVGGPRGSGRGTDLLREWFGRAGIRLEPLQVFHTDKVVVVEQRASWDGGEPQTIASVFVVDDGRVVSVLRYADLSSALERLK